MKTTKLREYNGITLIALVITIIILLILSGISISMLNGESGILTQTTKAKTSVENAELDEAVNLAVLAALTAGKNGDMDINVLNNQLSEIAGEEINIQGTDFPTIVTIKNNDYLIRQDGTTKKVMQVANYKGKEITASKATLTDIEGKMIVVPVGFKIKEDSTELVDEGIVVVAPDESEFVWVPVNNPSTMYGTDSEGNKLGKLYSFSSTGYSALNWTETDGRMSWIDATSNVEPALLSTYDTENGLTESELKSEFNQMIESVKLNKGFYVGRYETSLDENSKAQSISNVIPATASSDSANTWYGLYKAEKEYSVNNNLTNIVGSNMIWGSQYDQMMIWMQENGIDVTEDIGNNKNTGNTEADGSKVKGNTGGVETDKVNKIYDLHGNTYEWTLESISSNTRAFRGGVYDFTPPLGISNRYNTYPLGEEYTFISSRITLYIK